ncbi:MAG: hypothetical protein OXH13_10660 [Chloroflexi bacterium]|nr:hypothetical protein [Chloroflexota bacterium]MCY3697862.1 hypothetical protein [Chloroflexota bacterium]MXX32781.1 hypothetical protein [Chloroflexota bacterium]MXX80940.1 hypothetical protein [Chloroflexota bacterium]MYB22117.1 hypothetical protein [Chloroflexota bacterium]
MGIPTVTVGTSAFTDLLQLEAEQRGLPDLDRLIVPHPLGGLRPDRVRARVDDGVVDRLESALLGQGNGS